MLLQSRESLRRAKLQRNAHGITKWVFFFEGADAEYQSYVMPTFACPPFAEVSYLNASGKATSLWTYGVGDKSEAGGETYTSTDKNLTVSYPMTYSSAPILKVADGQTWQPYGISEKAGNISGLVNSVGVPPSLSVQHFGGNWTPKMTDERFAFGSNCLVEVLMASESCLRSLPFLTM